MVTSLPVVKLLSSTKTTAYASQKSSTPQRSSPDGHPPGCASRHRITRCRCGTHYVVVPPLRRRRTQPRNTARHPRTRRRIGRCFLTVSTPLGTDIVHPREARQPVTHPGCRTPHAVQQGPTRRG